MGQILNFAQKAIIEKGNKVLVIQNPENTKHNPGMIHFPGGRIKFGEDLDVHIKREVYEETGLKVKPLEPIALSSWTVKSGSNGRKEFESDDIHIIAVVRRCKYVSGIATLDKNNDDEELTDIYWIEAKKLVRNKKFDKKLMPALKAYLKSKK